MTGRTQTPRITSRDVDCPVCGAPRGERCRGSAYSGRGARTVDYHTARRESARAAAEPIRVPVVLCPCGAYAGECDCPELAAQMATAPLVVIRRRR